MSTILGRHAVVIGAGLGGLAAAGALAPHFERVSVLERDRLADGPAPRPGTPQCRQVHGLLAGGLQALCEILPDFDRDLAAAGAVPVRVAAGFREEVPGFDPFPRRDFGRIAYAASRPLLEHTLRRRLLARRNVVVRDRCRVLALVPAADRGGVAGVRCQDVDGSPHTMPADLVVDASGRGTLTLAALDALGRARPRETTVGVDIGYATLTFELAERRPDWLVALTFAGAPDRRSGFLLAIEEGRWMACIAQLHCAAPPRDLAEFLHAASRLRTPTIHDAVRNARPTGAPQRFGLAESSWRHFEAMAAFPEGLIPIGDAMCRFNPIYGQGMSVAAKEAGLLACLLRRRAAGGNGLCGLPQAYLAAVQPWIAGAWSMSATPDLAHAETRGERPADLEHRLAFVAALHRVAARDPAVHELLSEVRHLVRPESDLRDPDLVARVQAEMAASARSAPLAA